MSYLLYAEGHHTHKIKFSPNSGYTTTNHVRDKIRAPREADRVCHKCRMGLTTIWPLGSYLEKKMPEYGYIVEADLYCYFCLVDDETGFIKDLSLEQLPLFINHKWVTKEGDEFYLEILKDGKSSDMSERIRMTYGRYD